jgi:hypothetical protein
VIYIKNINNWNWFLLSKDIDIIKRVNSIPSDKLNVACFKPKWIISANGSDLCVISMVQIFKYFSERCNMFIFKNSWNMFEPLLHNFKLYTQFFDKASDFLYENISYDKNMQMFSRWLLWMIHLKIVYFHRWFFLFYIIQKEKLLFLIEFEKHEHFKLEEHNLISKFSQVAKMCIETFLSILDEYHLTDENVYEINNHHSFQNKNDKKILNFIDKEF